MPLPSKFLHSLSLEPTTLSRAFVRSESRLVRSDSGWVSLHQLPGGSAPGRYAISVASSEQLALLDVLCVVPAIAASE